MGSPEEQTPSRARRGPCIWLDGSAAKACRVLRARLEPLGYRVVCRSSLPDPLIAHLARAHGCVLVTSDETLASRHGAVYIPQRVTESKSARDLATRIAKLVFSRDEG